MSDGAFREGWMTEFEVRAAGGIVWRPAGDGGIEVLIVHRPRYDDWSFPKGKVDPGEEDIDAAWREVVEETGHSCEIGEELPSVDYVDDRGRSKIVRYWAMTVLDGEFVVNDEVDAVEWLPPAVAHRRLTHGRDGDVLAAFAARYSPRS